MIFDDGEFLRISSSSESERKEIEREFGGNSTCSDETEQRERERERFDVLLDPPIFVILPNFFGSLSLGPVRKSVRRMGRASWFFTSTFWLWLCLRTPKRIRITCHKGHKCSMSQKHRQPCLMGHHRRPHHHRKHPTRILLCCTACHARARNVKCGCAEVNRRGKCTASTSVFQKL